MRVLGIDPGTVSMGYGVVDEDGGDIAMVGCGTIDAARSSPLAQRLSDLHAGLLDIIARYQPAEAAIEEPFVAKNVRSAMAVGQAMGIAMAAVSERGIPAYRYTPTQVKQAATSYGRSSKGQVQEMVRLQLGLSATPKPQDAADALAVAICHIQKMRLARAVAAEEGK